MKKSIIFSMLLPLCFAIANAQTSEQFLVGGWRVSQAQPFTRVIAGTLPDSLFIRLNNVSLVDNQKARFSLTTDLGTYKYEEGSSAFVEARDLEIRLDEDGTYSLSTWRMPDETIPYYAMNWHFDPSRNEIITLASFPTPRLFVVESNARTNNCDQNGRMTLYVDGTAIQDENGNPLAFLQGSSVIGFAKLVQIKVTGSCGSNVNQYSGRLKVAK